MPRSAPQLISLAAVLVGTALFAATLFMVDRDATLRTAHRLGLALPLVLLPGAIWHVLRALGWYMCFPEASRPDFWRVFRVRLAADGVAYFTIRGLASEPLRVVLLLDRVPAAVSAAASVLERTAMGILSVSFVGAFSILAMSSDAMAPEWRRVFTGLAIMAGVVLAIAALLIARTGRYLGPLFAAIHRWTGWRWTSGRAVRFVAEVEALSLHLARADRWRLRALTVISIACYALMIAEVWIVFWAIGEPVAIVASAFVETFTRSASVLGGAIPANLGALEAANVAVAKGLGVAGAGSLALARRVRSLLWAGLGLALYPRDTLRPVGETRAR
jgi:hypothetical protein